MRKLSHEIKMMADKEYRERDETIRELREKFDFLESKGMTVGKMKTSDKPEPYLAYVIKDGSELCDNRTLEKLLDAEIELTQAKAEVEGLKEGIESAYRTLRGEITSGIGAEHQLKQLLKTK